MEPVKTEKVVTPGDLRAYLARHVVKTRDIAARRKCSRQAVAAALRADFTCRPVSQRLLREIFASANDILLERELEGDR